MSDEAIKTMVPAEAPIPASINSGTGTGSVSSSGASGEEARRNINTPPPQPSPGVPGERVAAEVSHELTTTTITLPAVEGAPADPTQFVEKKLLEGKVIEALQEIFDPEIPVNIYELGLIYDIKIETDNSVAIKMTLTAPACPVAGSLPGDVEKRVNAIPEVKQATVELVWDPPWTRERMSETAMITLGFM